ncbi:ABC transporter related protein [Coriobacterium glomerans PW2]|uniref:ABC transporter related protein n=1 Tax=Coriobacterium glomerans (strain ATCC 49209 / DSM 20642 / JCM 10262 / PW2) TaxID=700015 RepID=F2N8Y4_CORGP|nr:ABC transporter ATP-binding protein [Coriobacterium glomerans]AEB07584.1 ABC transporter related protein [Coriobacterium glomerans PW2]
MLGLFRRCKLLFTLNIFMGVAVAALTVAAATILELVLNAVIDADSERFGVMLRVALGYLVIMAAVSICAAIVEKQVVITAIRNLRTTVQQGILSRDNEHFGCLGTADYLSALTNDMKIVEENIVVPLLKSIQYALIFLMAAVALFFYSALIGAIMLGGLVLMYLLPSCVGGLIGKRQEAYSTECARYTSIVKDRLSGYGVLRACRLIERASCELATRSDAVASKKFAADRLLALSEGLAGVMGAVLQIATMLVTGVLVLRGEMLAGTLLAILQLSGAFVQPVAIIMQSLPMICAGAPVLSRLRVLGRPAPSGFSGNRVPRFEQEIIFDSVSFGYAAERPVLSGLSATLKKGESYVLVGESGCGKTTLVRLLAAERSDYAGAIRIDGCELHKLDVDRVLEMVSTVQQDAYLFDETLEYNISLGRSYSRERWARALTISGVDRFIARIGQGLSTQVGELGARLSGGQRQRIAVARAIIDEKPLLILDEGTNAVDARTACDIESALLKIDDLTLITITHDLRPELLRRYDTVLFMKHGRIEEIGSYDALIAKQGGFASFQSLRASNDNPTRDNAR